MPYIPKERIKAIFSESLTDFDSALNTKGELNYFLTYIMQEYILNHGLSYQNISDVIGAATDAAEEMRRRVLNPYEDKMKKKNGDVYKDVLKELKKIK